MSTKRTFKKLWLKTLVFMLCISLVFTASPVFAIEGTNGVSITPVEEKDAEILYEIVDDRTANQKVFRMDDGSYMTAQYEYDIHYKSGDGWENIDNTLITSAATDSSDFAGVEAENGARAVKFANNTSSGKVLRIKNGNAKIVWTVPNANKSKGQFVQLEESKESADANDKYLRLNKTVTQAIYPDVWDGVDLRYTVMGSSIKEEIIINNALSGYDFEFELELKKASLTQNADGSLTIADVDGNEIYTIPAPFMTDASGRYSQAVEYDVTVISEKNNKSTYRINVKANKAWINSAETVFPVVVDPTVTIEQSSYVNISDYYVDSTAPNESFDDSVLQVSNTCRTYIKLNELNIPCKPGDKIVGVYLGMSYIYTSNTTGSGTVEIHECTNWVDNPTWNNQPSYSSEILDYFEYDKTVSGTDNNANTEYAKTAYLDLTDLYDEWRESDVHGIMLKFSDSMGISGDCLKLASMNVFGSGTNSIYPRLTYVTKNFIGLEGYWSTHSQSVGESGAGYISDYTRGLTFAYNDFSIGGEYAATGVTHYYNSAYRGAKYTGTLTEHGVLDSSLPLPVYSANYGYGWHLGAQQSVTLMTTAIQYSQNDTPVFYSKYVYVDADGTYHWFNSEDDVTSNDYIDEDGLGLTLTVDSSVANLYVIKDQDNNKLLFNADGMVEKMVDRNGNTTTYTYDSAGKLTKITDASGRSITLAYTGTNLTSLTDTSGRTTTYQYSATYNATSYSTSGNYLRKIIRPDGSYTEFSYSSSGDLSRVYDSASDYSVNYGCFEGEVLDYYEQADGITGKSIRVAEMKYSTVYVDCGADGEFDTNDDIETYYCFDRYGRTTSSYTDAEDTYYTSAQEYTSGIADMTNAASDARKVNRIKVGAMSGGSSYNLLSNGNFEYDTLQDWTATLGTGCTGELNTQYLNSYFGTNSLKISSSGTSAVTGKYTHTPITLPAGKYTLSAYVNTDDFSSTAGGAYIKLGSNRSAYISQSTTNNIDGGWKRLTVSLTLSSATSVVVTLGVSSAKGTAYFDGIQLESGSYGDFNLLENGSFDAYSSATSADNWIGSAYTRLSSHDGRKNVICVTGDPNQSKTISNTVIAVNPSNKYSYIISGWAKASSSNGFNNSAVFALEIRLNYTDNSAKDFRFNFNPVYDRWQSISGVAVPEEGKTVKSVAARLVYDNNINVCYFDDIALTRGEASCYTYDENGNVTKVESNSKNTTTMVYEGNNLTSVTDEDGTSTYTYDANNNITGATTVGGMSTTYAYNTNGTVSNVKASNGTQNIYTSYGYSASGNYISSVVSAMGGTSYYNYNESKGLLTSATDSTGLTTSYTYNSNNDMLLSVTSGSGSSARTVSYNYNTKKQLTRLIHNGFNYSFSYDSFGNMDGAYIGSRVLSLNNFDYITGNLVYSEYGNGWNKVYDYDHLGRLVSTNSADMYNDTTYATTNYKYNKLGQLARFYDSLSGITTDYDYDALGRLSTVRTSDGSLDRYYNYNQKGQLSNQSYSGYFGLYKDQNFSYNADGYLFNMTDDPASTTNTIDQFGRVTQHQLVDMTGGNTVYTTGYTYAGGSGGANATTTLVGTESISGFGSYNYDYLPNGNIYWQKNTRNGVVKEICYTYDGLGQLISEDNQYINKTIEYTYDAGGNITSRKTYNGVWETFDETSLVTDTYTYGDSQWKDLLTAYNGNTITYDEIGNPLTYKNGEVMYWVGGRRLSEIDFDDCGDMLFFDYDSDGMRLRKYGPRVDVYNNSYVNNALYYVDYYYDGDTLIYERRSAEGDNDTTYFVIEYLYGVNGIVGFKINNGTTVTTYYYVKNVMGDVLGIVDSSGVLVAEYRYDAYGNPVMILDGNGNDVSANYSHIANINPIRYRGYYYDVETGFYYLNSRYYDPAIGRFINADGVMSGAGGAIQGNNMFAYCFNNPVNMLDADGNWPEWMKKAAKWFDDNIVKPVAKFIDDISEDLSNYDSKNESEEKVFDSNYISSYKGKLVIKTPFESSFSFGFIGLSVDQQDSETLNHEYGHCIQFEELGIIKYAQYIALPSLKGYWGGVTDKDYYSQPWEYGADMYGGVNRDDSYYHEDAEENYKIYWDKITK